jgi:hypothetical protein
LFWVFDFEPTTASQTCVRKYLEKCLGDRKFWTDASLEEFMSCEWNMAFNRQTRMFALYDSKFDMCKYLQKLGDRFTLKEDEELVRGTLILFEKVFDNTLKFDEYMEPKVSSNTIFDFRIRVERKREPTESVIAELDRNQLEQIRKHNYLDFQLYEFAREFFFIVSSFSKQSEINILLIYLFINILTCSPK